MTENEMMNTNILTEEQKKKKDKEVFRVLILLGVVGFIGILLFVGFFFAMTYGVKQSEVYAVAYDALITSDEFLSSGASEEDIRLGTYNISVNGSEGEAVFSFRADGEYFTVYCQKKAGVWNVCEIVVSFIQSDDFFGETEIEGNI
jgi:hypothetical protein